MTLPTPRLRRFCLAWMLMTGGAAFAQSSPYYIGVNQAFSYNSNVFRQVDEFAQSSWWSSTSVVGGFDQRYGRQRFYANGNVAANVYEQLSQLDNTSYGVTAGWDWETIERLSGKLYASYNQSLADYGGFNVSDAEPEECRRTTPWPMPRSSTACCRWSLPTCAWPTAR